MNRKQKGTKKRAGGFKAVLESLILLMALGACKTVDKRPVAQESDPLSGGGTAWTAELDKSRKSLVLPPEKIPLFSRILLRRAEKEFEKEVVPGRVLTWSTNLGVAAGALELYTEKGAAKFLTPRMVYLLRMQVSYHASSPFAIDVNSWKYKDHNITTQEIRAMQAVVEPGGSVHIDEVASFSAEEKAALKYAAAMTCTPVRFEGQLLEEMRALFNQEEIVAIAALSAKVNYWARFIEAMRIKPAGYTDDAILELDRFNTFVEPSREAAAEDQS